MKTLGGRLCAVSLLAVVAWTGPAGAQERAPSIPGGATAAVMPLQSARPAPGGGWPGGAASMEETIQIFNAEVNFALGELREGTGWTSPADVVRRAARNPMVKHDPRRLAYRSILEPTDRPLSDPLHSQLRALSALLNTETVAVPLRVFYRPPVEDEEEGNRTGAGDTARSAGAGTDAPGPEASRGRAVVLLALVNTRRGRVLWHGEIAGRPGPPDSSALLSTLAARLVSLLNPS